jgi:DNA-binding transcriptional MerR regulator
MRIGEIAARAAVNVQTLRYYERRGLLAPPARRASGYRDFDSAAVERVRFIRHAQQLGFTLGEITELLALRVEGGAACADVERRARATIARVDRQVAALRRMRTTLVRLAKACRSRAPTGDCPVLSAIERSELRV